MLSSAQKHNQILTGGLWHVRAEVVRWEFKYRNSSTNKMFRAWPGKLRQVTPTKHEVYMDYIGKSVGDSRWQLQSGACETWRKTSVAVQTFRQSTRQRTAQQPTGVAMSRFRSICRLLLMRLGVLSWWERRESKAAQAAVLLYVSLSAHKPEAHLPHATLVFVREPGRQQHEH